MRPKFIYLFKTGIRLLFILASFLASTKIFSQAYTNRGKDFWVGYQFTQTFSNTVMKIYLGALANGDSVTIAIAEGTPNEWKRTYWVPANSTIASDEIPRMGPQDARLLNEGLHGKKGIHITSKNHPIVAYAHLYYGANSGATMLLPVNLFASENYVFTNRQRYNGPNSYSVFHIVASKDSTWVEINPSKPTVGGMQPNGGAQPNGSYLVKLNKGDVYQVFGAMINGSDGHDLTGSTVRSVANNQGLVHSVGVFCGSSRTVLGCSPTGGSTGDLIIQQVFPYQLWGTRYATAPFNIETSSGPFIHLAAIFRVLVKDSTTIVYRNGVQLPVSSLIGGRYYEYTSNGPDYITADKPVLVAQYMTTAGECGNPSNLGDPEMIYLTPLSNAIPQTAIYRNNVMGISQNFLSLVIPSAGLNSLQIDGVLLSNIAAANKLTYGHPNLPGYSVVVRKWPSAQSQCYVQSNYAFTGITYGVGSVESYGYNIGSQFDSSNLESIKYNTIIGSFFLDHNKNAVKDAGEPLYTFGRLETIKQGKDTFSTFSSTGSFVVYTDTGTFISKGIAHSPKYTILPASKTSTFNSYYNTDTLWLAVQTIPGYRDLSLKIIATGRSRPGQRLTYKLICKNEGTDTADAQIKLVKSSKLTYDSASITPFSMTADTLRWNILALKPSETKEIVANFTVMLPPVTSIGDTIYSIANVSSNAPDMVPSNDTAFILQRATNSYDPNDKTENHGGQISMNKVARGEYLQYTIRFQNTGNDTAFLVVIRDTLDSKLDWNSFSMISASHDYQLNMKEGICSWVFNNINLVDSNRNEPLSHGYISFIIKAKTAVLPGEVINNKASIYFDHNLPIVTNTESTIVLSEPLPVRLLSFSATHSNQQNVLVWRTRIETGFSHFEIERSRNGIEFIGIGKAQGGNADYRFTDNGFEKGFNYYRLKMVNVDGQYAYSAIKKVNNSGEFGFSIYPNPVKDILSLKVDAIHNSVISIQVMMVDGRVVINKTVNIVAGASTIPVNVAALQSGSYFVRIVSSGTEVNIFRIEKK